MSPLMWPWAFPGLLKKEKKSDDAQTLFFKVFCENCKNVWKHLSHRRCSVTLSSLSYSGKVRDRTSWRKLRELRRGRESRAQAVPQMEPPGRSHHPNWTKHPSGWMLEAHKRGPSRQSSFGFSWTWTRLEGRHFCQAMCRCGQAPTRSSGFATLCRVQSQKDIGCTRKQEQKPSCAYYQ